MNTSWISPLRAMLAVAALLCLGLSAQATAPLAGTVIGNAASATYKDNTNVVRQVTSNVVTTVVQQVYGFTLVADRTASVAPGGQAFFPHTVTNTGNGSDSYTLSVVNKTGDNFDLSSLHLYADLNQDGIPDNTTDLAGTAIPLGAGGEYHFVVVGTAPGTATSGQSALITVTATPTAVGQTAATNTDTATVTANAVIAITKAISRDTGPAPADTAASQADPLTYSFTYTNTGNSAASNLTLTDVIPANLIYVAGSATWSGTSGTITDAAGGDPVGISYDYNLTSAGRVTAVIASVNPGASGVLTFKVRVTPAVAPQTINNTARFSYDPTGTGQPPGPDAPSNTVPYVVTQNAGVALGSPSAAANGETPANAGSEIYTVAAGNPGSTVTFVNAVYNLGNGTDSFDLTIPANTFPAGTSFALYKSDGSTPLVDTDGNGVPDTGPVAPGTTSLVVIKVILPGSATSGGPYTLTARATSHVAPAQTNTVVDQLTAISGLYVDLTNNAARGDVGALGVNSPLSNNTGEASPVVTNATDPGATTRFTLYATNPNGVPDNYNLGSNTAIAFNGGSVPPGWTVVFRDAATNAVITNTGTIAPGGNKKFYADVTPPAGTPPGTTDIFFRVLSPSTGSFDILHDAVTVNAVRNLTLQLKNTGQTYPGGVVFYSHVLTNQGNVTEGSGAAGSLIALATSDTLSAQGWNSVVYSDANNNGVVDTGESIVTAGNFATLVPGGLAPGQSVSLIVKVFAPAGAANLSSSVTTLTATTTNQVSTGNYSGSAPAVVTTTDTTNVILGNLTITKQQSATNGSGYGTAQIGRSPGQTIYYLLTVTNAGTANSTEAVVYDSTPAFTTYDATNGPATVTVVAGSLPASPIIAAPGNGATGNFSFTLGSLPPATVVQITFAVKINQ